MSGQHKVLRGGSWDDIPQVARSASHIRAYMSNRYNHYGFRIVGEGLSSDFQSLRGGSWEEIPMNVVVDNHRVDATVDYRFNSVGFRIVEDFK